MSILNHYISNKEFQRDAPALIRCFSGHWIEKIKVNGVCQITVKGEYRGVCCWCGILTSSRSYAKRGQYKPLLLPSREVPWIFFPRTLREQNYTCFIPWCKTKTTAKKQLQADHDHVTGHFRGWVCGYHNRSFMTSIDEAESHGEIVTLSFSYPGVAYYPQPKKQVNAHLYRQAQFYKTQVASH